jgi:hypothetical protein
MKHKKLRPVTPLATGTGLGLEDRSAAFSVPTINPSRNELQVWFLARRLGDFDPATLAAIASLAFGEMGRS